MLKFISNRWEETIIPTLCEYVKIPNKSPLFDPEWSKHGYMQRAVDLFANWAQTQKIKGLEIEVIKTGERTPIILIDIQGQLDGSILFYGHLDKQPEMTGWAPDLGPWTPVRKGEHLYGRGSADDGYALFCALTAIASLQHTNTPHPRCMVLIEACEESGSYDLPFYMEQEKNRIGTPKLVIGLDSGCGNYEQLWSTTSLRGVITGHLTVNVLTEGVHSGNASGIVPSSFRIIRHLLSRIENEVTGEILVPELYTDIPHERINQAKQAAEILKNHSFDEFPFLPDMKPMHDEPFELILNRTWRPTLSVIGAEGLPAGSQAGNVLRPSTTLKLSFRTPPNCQLDNASHRLKTILEAEPPYGAKVTFDLEPNAPGWNAPPLAPWLKTATNEASEIYFGKPAAYMGEGGSIPFMGMLGEKFPKAQFLITGVLGPHSNAHGPNEFLHIEYAKKLTACIAHIIQSHSL